MKRDEDDKSGAGGPVMALLATALALAIMLIV